MTFDRAKENTPQRTDEQRAFHGRQNDEERTNKGMLQFGHGEAAHRLSSKVIVFVCLLFVHVVRFLVPYQREDL